MEPRVERSWIVPAFVRNLLKIFHTFYNSSKTMHVLIFLLSKLLKIILLESIVNISNKVYPQNQN